MKTRSFSHRIRCSLLAAMLSMGYMVCVYADTIVVQNLYFPKPGLEQEVLKTRLEASSVRRKLGLQVGRVLLHNNEVDGQPYVIWECDYPTLQAREKDAAAAENAPAFQAVQKKMSDLIARFERTLWTVRDQ
jgi:hypothetical protein